MRKRMLLFTVLFVGAFSLSTIWGCGGGGGGGSSSSIQVQGTGGGENSGYSAYVFGPGSSGQSLFKLYNLADTTTDDGILVLDSPEQAPTGFVPLEGCTVTLPDGTEAVTDGSGRFQFSRMPLSNSEKGMPLLIDPSHSNRPRFARIVIPLVVPRRGVEIPQNTEGLRLVVKPSSLLSSLGSRFLYHAFLVDDNTGALYPVPPNEVTWSVDDSGIGTILPNGVFRSATIGKGQVIARVTINSVDMPPAYGDVQVVDNQEVARIYGQVTDVLQSPIARVIIFVSGFENGVVTDSQGNYLIPRVPTGESLTLTFVYRGIVVNTLNDVVVGDGEAKEINVTLDTFHEIGKISYQPAQDQTGGKVILAVEGLAGPLSTDEFPTTKEFELLKVDEVNHNLYTRLQQDPNLSVSVMVEGTPRFSSADDGNSLPQVEVGTIQVLNAQPTTPVQTMQGDVSWQEEGGVNFRTNPRNPNVAPMQFVLYGMENFPRVLTRLQEASGNWFSAKLIGQVDRTNRSITLLDISLINIFFQGKGKVYYNPEFASNNPELVPKGAILMEISSGSDPAAGQNDLSRPYLLLNVEAISPDVYNLLISSSSADRKFSCSVSGVEVDDPNWAEDDCQPLKVSQIQIYSDSSDYLLHRLGKIQRDDNGNFRFAPSLPVSGNGAGYYLLEGVGPDSRFDEDLTSVKQSPGIDFSCYLSGEIEGAGGSKINVSQLEILGQAVDQEGSGAGVQPTGFVYYTTDVQQLNSSITIGKYLYRKFVWDGSTPSIDESELFELTNLRRTELGDLLQNNPGMIIQVTLNATETSALSGGITPPINTITTRLIVNDIKVLNNADPLYQVSGNLIYHSWENVLELVATSSVFPKDTYQNFVLQKVPDSILSQFMNHPDRFVPVSGIIQVLQTNRRANSEPLTAKALDLTILTSLN